MQEVQSVAEKELWSPYGEAISIRQFYLPRPLLWAGRFAQEEENRLVSAELHYLVTKDCVPGADVESLRRKYAKLSIFTKDMEEGSQYVFQCADIVLRTNHCELYIAILDEWMREGTIGARWRSAFLRPHLK